MRIVLFNLQTNKSVVEFIVKVDEYIFKIRPKIYDSDFSYLLDDITFIRVKWMTVYLNNVYNNLKEIERYVVNDIHDILKDEIKYRNLIGGAYKIFIL